MGWLLLNADKTVNGPQIGYNLFAACLGSIEDKDYKKDCHKIVSYRLESLKDDYMLWTETDGTKVNWEPYDLRQQK